MRINFSNYIKNFNAECCDAYECEDEESEPMQVPAPVPQFSDNTLQHQREQLDLIRMQQEMSLQDFMNILNLVGQVYGGLPPNTPQRVQKAISLIALMTAAKINPQYAEILKNAGFGA